MATVEQLEAALNAHILDDAGKHGQMLGALGRIETHLVYMRQEQERMQDAAENTGSHHVAGIEKRAEFWPKLIGGIVAALVVAGLTGLVTFLLTHR